MLWKVDKMAVFAYLRGEQLHLHDADKKMIIIILFFKHFFHIER